MYYESCVVSFDGAARHNPHGPAGCGWVVSVEDAFGTMILGEGKRFLGVGVSNNQAEYQGLIAGLQYCLQEGIKCDELIIRGDSEIVIRQMLRDYLVRSDRIRPLYDKAEYLLDNLEGYVDNIVFEHVRRSDNSRADGLANRAIDERLYQY
jgi:ribonuclease HI